MFDFFYIHIFMLSIRMFKNYNRVFFDTPKNFKPIYSLFIQIRNQRSRRVVPKNILKNDCKTKFGPLTDENRVFTNLYGQHNCTLSGALKRGDWYKTKDIILKGSDWICDETSKAGFRGRGGAGFFVGTKFGFMKNKKTDKPKYLVVNAAEGEPGTCKDREIIRHEPHKLLEGAFIAGFAMGAKSCYIFIRAKFYNEACCLQMAILEAYREGLLGRNACGSGVDFDIYMQRGAGRYICGEETALVKTMMGQQSRPSKKPPYLADKGVFDCSTTVFNVETLSMLPTLLRRGAAWFSSLGRTYNSGTKLFNIVGNVERPCTVEEEMSISMKELIERHAGGVSGGWNNLLAVIPGGASSPILPRKLCDVASMDFDSLNEIGSSLGTGGVIVISKDRDVIKCITNFMHFYERESCRQCTQCREGSHWMCEMSKRFEIGNAQPIEVDFVINEIYNYIRGKTICAFGDAHAGVFKAFAFHFRKELENRMKQHLCRK